ncbi:hypothetical protein STEG23_011326 [Scotinomys teguina]
MVQRTADHGVTSPTCCNSNVILLRKAQGTSLKRKWKDCKSQIVRPRHLLSGKEGACVGQSGIRSQKEEEQKEEKSLESRPRHVVVKITITQKKEKRFDLSRIEPVDGLDREVLDLMLCKTIGDGTEVRKIYGKYLYLLRHLSGHLNQDFYVNQKS